MDNTRTVLIAVAVICAIIYFARPKIGYEADIAKRVKITPAEAAQQQQAYEALRAKAAQERKERLLLQQQAPVMTPAPAPMPTAAPVGGAQ